ncbi:hypothetical protein CQA57_01165 [Helicobacter anseris]|uniref:Autotransporter domain-containing protein n=1 Tax=Helicobacter anseris TaxID=375926 RepID=A0A3D8JA19_9HELI|nr:autotransporter outer membrane beta-barrel domain-containing protein [Helicobacter anseris]RDU74353.1 hypothetical protein CQA57_01165 [Helicobacter anseris]
MNSFRYLALIFLSSNILLSLSSEWIGFIPSQDSNITLNSNDDKTVILKRDPTSNQSKANDFGGDGSPTNLNYSSNGNSTLRLIRDSAISDMVFYHIRGNRISVNQGASLIIDLQNRGTEGRFYFYGGEMFANNGGKIQISGVHIVIIGDINGGLIEARDGGRIELSNIGFVKSVSRTSKASVINSGGELIVKSNFYNSGFLEKIGSVLYADSAGFFEHKNGNTTIEGLFYNSGFDGGYRREALLKVNSGNFKVVGNFQNGGDFVNEYGKYSYGIGSVIATGGVIDIGGNLTSKSEDANLRSKIDLTNTILKANILDNQAGSDIFVSGGTKIQVKKFISSTNSSINFIGINNGFGEIEATESIALDGAVVNFKIASAFSQSQNLEYVITQSPQTTGLKDGEVILLDANNNQSDRYGAKLVSDGNQYKLVLEKKFDDTNNGNNTDNRGNIIGNKEKIAKELEKHLVILNSADLNNAVERIDSQIHTLLEEYQTLDNSMAYFNLLSRNTISQAQVALNTMQKQYLVRNDIALVQNTSDFNEFYLDSDIKNNFFVNALVGYGGKSSRGGGMRYGVNLGFDRHFSDWFFGGIYGVFEKRNFSAKGLNLDSLSWQLGAYMRFGFDNWEIDVLASYLNVQSNYQRDFSINTQQFIQKGNSCIDDIGLQGRLGYRFGFANNHSLKPYFGALGDYYLMPSLSEDGDFGITANKNYFFNLYGVGGLEYRKIFEKSSFFATGEFAGGSNITSHNYTLYFGDEVLSFRNKVSFFGSVLLGADFALNDFFGIQINVKTKIYNTGVYLFDTNFGLRFLF